VTVLDRHHRPLGALRISVTDRCNLRCRYCMPAASYRWLPQESLLTDAELTRLAGLFAGLGARKLRITGGEPLLRPALHELVASLRALPDVDDLALTTNATHLAPQAAALRSAGLDRITVSIDTLQGDRMKRLARHDRLEAVVAGLDAARAAGFRRLKTNTVVIRHENDDEVGAIVRFATARGLEPRFIEYMDVGGATEWSQEHVVSGAEIVERLAGEFGGAQPLRRGDDPHAPAERWRLGDGTIVGVVTSTTAPFCRDCDRSRLTADGKWFTCLYATRGTDLAAPLRAGATDAELRALITSTWSARTDRGAEERLRLPDRGALVSLTRLRDDPWLEMHVRGG
jgi:cyclic pyranopterin phosphate synthase